MASGVDGISVVGLILQCSVVVGDIVRRAIEAKHFHRDCIRIRDDCIVVLELIRKNSEKRVDLLSYTRLDNCFRKARTFLEQCGEEWGLIHATVEVLFRRKHAVIFEELKWAISLFTVDALTAIMASTTDQHTAGRELQRYLDCQFENLRVRDETQSTQAQAEIRALSREVARFKPQTLEIARLGAWIKTFRPDDPLLRLSPDSILSEGAQGIIDDSGRFICHKLVRENSAAGSQLPRLINIYSRLSQRTVARKLLGIVEEPNQSYALMESIESFQTLEDLLSSGEFARASLARRLRFCWEICNAAAYFHSVNILLKTLSSQNIFVAGEMSGTQHLRPILNDLENARLITETSVQQESDIRFEAPDFHIENQKMHSIYTDIWSLGVLIRTCVTAELPFEMGPITDDDEKEAIRGRLRAWTAPAAIQSVTNIRQLRELINSCFQSPAYLRPPAAWVIEVAPSTDTTEISSAKERCYSHVREARNGKRPKKNPEVIVREEDVSRLVNLFENSSNSQLDPLCLFLVGSLAWWRLIPGSVTERRLDITDSTSRARFVVDVLYKAWLAGFSDAALELSLAHQELARAYSEAQALQLPILPT